MKGAKWVGQSQLSGLVGLWDPKGWIRQRPGKLCFQLVPRKVTIVFSPCPTCICMWGTPLKLDIRSEDLFNMADLRAPPCGCWAMWSRLNFFGIFCSFRWKWHRSGWCSYHKAHVKETRRLLWICRQEKNQEWWLVGRWTEDSKRWVYIERNYSFRTESNIFSLSSCFRQKWWWSKQKRTTENKRWVYIERNYSFRTESNIFSLKFNLIRLFQAKMVTKQTKTDNREKVRLCLKKQSRKKQGKTRVGLVWTLFRTVPFLTEARIYFRTW